MAHDERTDRARPGGTGAGSRNDWGRDDWERARERGAARAREERSGLRGGLNTPGDRRRLLLGCGAVGVLGAFAVALADLVGIALVEQHDPISETISELAIGRYAWVQDLGIDLLAVGVVACAAGLYLWRAGGAAWKAGVLLLFVLGIDLVLIAEHNQYAGRPGTPGAVIHIYLVYALYGIVALASLLLSFGLERAGRAWQRFGLAVFAGWTLLAPLFFVVPTAWDGAYERLMGALLVTWIAALAWLLIRTGRRGST